MTSLLKTFVDLALFPRLFIVFFALGVTSVLFKLGGLTAWSWRWTLAPFSVAALLALAILAVVIAANLAPDVP